MNLLASKMNPTLYTATLGDGDGKADATVKVGGDLSKFVPNVNATKWNNEAWINLNYKAMTVGTEKEAVADYKVSLKVGGVTWKSWTLGTGVLECSLTYDSPKDLPTDGIIRLELKDSGNLEYYFQGALTQAEFDEGCIRPDNVVGSYAVYFGKSNNNYKTGKFAHLFRWEAIGNDEKRKWCEPLKIEDGQLVIGLPDTSDMVFPVTFMGAGDTIGFTHEGGTGGNFVGNDFGIQATAGSSFTADTYHMYASSSVEAAVWNDNGSNYPNELLIPVNTMTSGSGTTWYTASINVSIASGNKYWLGLHSAFVAYDSAACVAYSVANAGADPSDPFTVGGTARNAYKASFYLSGAASTPAPTRRRIRVVTTSSLLPLWFLGACVRNRDMSRRDWWKVWKWLG